MLLGRTYMTNIDSLLKSRDVTVPIKIHIFKTTLCPSNHELMWDLDHEEGWALKNWCFWTMVLEKTLESLLDSNEIKSQSILKEISPEYSLEELMLKLKLQSFGHLMWRANSLEKSLMLGKIEGKRRRGWQRMSWLDGLTDSMDRSLSRRWEIVKDREGWHAAVHGVAKSRTWQQLNNTKAAYRQNACV